MEVYRNARVFGHQSLGHDSYSLLANVFMKLHKHTLSLMIPCVCMMAACASVDNHDITRDKIEYFNTEANSPPQHWIFFTEDGLYGYQTASGERITKAMFDYATLFSEGVAAVLMGDRWYVLSCRDGRLRAVDQKVNPQFSVGVCSEGSFLFISRDKEEHGYPAGYFDVYGNVFYYTDDSSGLDKFAEGFGTVHKRYGGTEVIDASGSQVAIFEDMGIRSFSQGLAAAYDARSGKWGYVNGQFAWVIPPDFDGAKSFSNGRAAVSSGGNCGYIDVGGKLVGEMRYKVALSCVLATSIVQTHSREWLLLDAQGDVLQTLGKGSLDDILPGSFGYAISDNLGEVIFDDVTTYYREIINADP